MIHASVELVEAMRGIEPFDENGLQRHNDVGDSAAIVACAPATTKTPEDCVAYATLATNRRRGHEDNPSCGQTEDKYEVTCRKCLALMDEARGYSRTTELLVHRDALLERGEAA